MSVVRKFSGYRSFPSSFSREIVSQKRKKSMRVEERVRSERDETRVYPTRGFGIYFLTFFLFSFSLFFFNKLLFFRKNFIFLFSLFINI